MKKFKELKATEPKTKEPKVKAKLLGSALHDIFDETDISDLPDSVKLQATYFSDRNRLSVRTNTGKVYFLFKMAEELTLNQIIIGLYRQFKHELANRNVIASSVHYLVKDGVLIRKDKGVYARGSNFHHNM